MGIAEELNKLRSSFKTQKRHPQEEETDDEELKESGVMKTIQRGDTRLRGGFNYQNLTESERDKIKKYRSQGS